MRRRPGFTLIEVLLSAAIAALAVGLVYSIFHTVTRTLDRDVVARREPHAVLDALQRLSEDVERAAVS
jgi:prepilin-type N-terminal cleavage/methylation domain-containing protein